MTTPLDKKFSPWWIAWIAAFGLVEGAALLDKDKGDTLTEHIRKWLALQNPKKPAGRIAAAAFLAWLTYHFLG